MFLASGSLRLLQKNIQKEALEYPPRGLRAELQAGETQHSATQFIRQHCLVYIALHILYYVYAYIYIYICIYICIYIYAYAVLYST